MPHGIVPGTFTTVSCEPGDTVVIVWDEKCSNYCILQVIYSLRRIDFSV